MHIFQKRDQIMACIKIPRMLHTCNAIIQEISINVMNACHPSGKKWYFLPKFKSKEVGIAQHKSKCFICTISPKCKNKNIPAD